MFVQSRFDEIPKVISGTKDQILIISPESLVATLDDILEYERIWHCVREVPPHCFRYASKAAVSSTGDQTVNIILQKKKKW